MLYNKFFSLQQAAKKLNIHYLKLVELVKTRKITCHKIRKRYYISEIQLNKMLGEGDTKLVFDDLSNLDIKEVSFYIGLSWQVLRQESLDNNLTYASSKTSRYRKYSTKDIIKYLQKTEIKAINSA